AFRALAAEADAAALLLRGSLAEVLPLERQTRIEQLLRRLDRIHIAELRLPKGIRVKSIDELMKRERENWEDGDYEKNGSAATFVSSWAEYTEEALPILVEMLVDHREHFQMLAQQAFLRLGARGKSALPALKAAEARAQASDRPGLRRAIQAVASAQRA